MPVISQLVIDQSWPSQGTEQVISIGKYARRTRVGMLTACSPTPWMAWGDSHHFMAGPALEGHGPILAVARLSVVACQYRHVRAGDTQKSCGERRGGEEQ